MKSTWRPCLAVLAVLVASSPAPGQADGGAVLFSDVRIFNGVDAELTRGHVLVRGRTISRITREPIPAPPGAAVIDGGGRILSPGFIDIHAHLTLQMPRDRLTDHPWVTGALAGEAARFYLYSGFTTVRDAGGTHPSFARAIDDGLLVGPRIFPSGATVSQTRNALFVVAHSHAPQLPRRDAQRDRCLLPGHPPAGSHVDDFLPG